MTPPAARQTLHDDARSIRSLCEVAHQTALDHGWWNFPDGQRNEFELLALVHSEISEAVEELRSGRTPADVHYNWDRAVKVRGMTATLPKPEGYLSELADVLIRIGDIVEHHGLTNEFLAVLEQKLNYNQHRPYRHGDKTA